MSQTRQPAGVPTGGQFAASHRAEAVVSLAGTAPEPKRYAWSTDETKVKPPKAAVAFVADAEDAGMDVDVVHDSHSVQVHITDPSGRNRMGVTWTAGSFHDHAPGRLSFHTTPGRPGVRFNYAEGQVHGQWVSPRSARQARLYMNLPETPENR